MVSILDRRKENLSPGDEYTLVDEWADVLGIRDWYQWKADEGTHEIIENPRPQGTTNPQLLKDKHPAAVWYLLSALERFERMSNDQIRAVTFEVGVLGASGIDYASSEAKYTLKAFPDEQFSGLQLMCLMYAGFQRFAPDQDVGMDLRGPFLTALELHERKRRGDG